MRVAFATFGCKINQYDTDRIRLDIERQGGTIVPFDGDADVYVINTCSVTGKADYQCRQKIRSATRRAEGAVVIVTGCYAEISPEEVRTMPGVTLVVGNRDKSAIGDVVSRYGIAQRKTSSKSGTVPQRTRTVLKVQDGCDNRCSYCIVPSARGASRSVPYTEVLRSFDSAIKAGSPEVVVSGIHIGSFGNDLTPATTLSTLLGDLVQRRGEARIRLSSIEPNEITPEIVSLLGSGLCRHLHIPLQSGDDDILKAMNRRYTASNYRALADSIAEQVPDVCLGADIMVGFPGEDDRAFENTYRLIERSPLTHLHIFSYSPRPGTPAAGMDNQVAGQVKKERNERLRALGKKKNLEFRKRMIGRIVEVVEEIEQGVTTMRSGLSDNYARVTIENGNFRNVSRPIKVLVKDVNESGLIGHEVSN